MVSISLMNNFSDKRCSINEIQKFIKEEPLLE